MFFKWFEWNLQTHDKRTPTWTMSKATILVAFTIYIRWNETLNKKLKEMKEMLECQ